MNLGGSNKSFLSDTPPISGNVGDMMGISPRGLLNQSLNASINANPEYSR